MNKKDNVTIVLAGNPNVGKSTIFNSLTGMHQHTGNWAGKTVTNSEGIWKAHRNIRLIDSPGCYSLEASSKEEEVAKEQICDKNCQGVIVVCDGTCLERNLILALQILAVRKDVIICINLMDQVRKRGIKIDTLRLGKLLGIQVIETENGKKKEAREKLQKAVKNLLDNNNLKNGTFETLKTLKTPEDFAFEAERIVKSVLTYSNEENSMRDKMDVLLTNPLIGYPIMLVSLLVILWITIVGANYPSELLSKMLFSFEAPLMELLSAFGIPSNLCEMLVYGMYRILVWVVSVMLPPMAIFFPLFTLLEDWGILPRIAFNLDRCFKSCAACGKQALTMCMGLGCNASAVVGCRIIDSPRERILAILTNSIMPCNGRFPILIAIIAMFFAGESGIKSASILLALIILSILMTMACTKILSCTILKGMASSFVLELPPYRRPQVIKVLIRSLLDRTLIVLGRAVLVAAPAGAFIWVLANVPVDGSSILFCVADFLDPIGSFIGLDGVILTAFILGIPANEIVLPIAMMIYLSQGTLIEISDLNFFKNLLVENGWTMLTALNVMFFSLMHWPCATTLLSIKKETGGWKWVLISVVLPLAMGTTLCLMTTSIHRFFL
ncbi:MAG: ferrous iron transporter B [Firmicutes bacterium]|nr:ferrous iron transporter B [Bacillota bacterium]